MEQLALQSEAGDPEFINRYGELLEEGAKIDHLRQSVMN